MNPLSDPLLTPLQAASHAAYFMLPALSVLALLLIGGAARTRRLAWAGAGAVLLLNLPRILVNAGGAADGPYIGPQYNGAQSELLLSGVWPPEAWGFLTQAFHAGWLLVLVAYFSRRARYPAAVVSVGMLAAAAWGQGHFSLGLALGFACGGLVTWGMVRVVRPPAGREGDWPRAYLDEPLLERDWRVMTPLLAIWLAINFGYLYFATYALPSQEAYQWYFSRRVEWGYYSKPPVTAWINWLTTMLSADTQWGIRSAAVIEGTMVLVVVADFVRRITPGTGPMYLASLLLVSMPFFSSGLAMTHDANNTMAAVWMVTVYLYYRAWESGGKWWIFTGLALGACILSKYTGGLLLLAGAVHLWAYKADAARREGALWALAVALIVCVPHVIWLWSKDWLTMRHTATLGDELGISGFRSLLVWFADQLLPVSPLVLFFLLGVSAVAAIRLRRSPVVAIPWFSWAILYFMYGGIAVTRSTLQHWTTPAFLSLPIVAGALYAVSRWRRLMLIAALVACAPGLLLSVLAREEMGRLLEPVKTGEASLFGYGPVYLDYTEFFVAPFAVAPRLSAHLQKDPELFVMGVGQAPALYSLYIAGQPPVYKIPMGFVESQFELWGGLEAHEGDDALFAVRGRQTDAEPLVDYLLANGHFAEAQFLEEIPEIPVADGRMALHGYTLYRLKNFHYHEPGPGVGSHLMTIGTGWGF